MASNALDDVLRGLTEGVAAELRPVLEAFLSASEHAPEDAWQALLAETLRED